MLRMPKPDRTVISVAHSCFKSPFTSHQHYSQIFKKRLKPNEGMANVGRRIAFQKSSIIIRSIALVTKELLILANELHPWTPVWYSNERWVSISVVYY